jgi:predicted O-methyltransferase YrrM
MTYRLWDALGVTPIRYHYHQPLPRIDDLPERTWVRDQLTGIDFNVDGQLSLLSVLNYQSELAAIPIDDTGDRARFFYNNLNFGSGDAEIYYSLVRQFRPKCILEIGGGYSTLIAHMAVEANGGGTEHICVEPYEQPWLEQIGLSKVIRARAESLPLDLFTALGVNDILFIDSSHVLRAGGDVWFEYLQILPNLGPGVLVHVHDVFLPYPYPKEWLKIRRLYWTEQFLLQAVLQNNSSFKVLLALYFLSQEHRSDLARACPVYATQQERGPGSFWMRKC